MKKIKIIVIIFFITLFSFKNICLADESDNVDMNDKIVDESIITIADVEEYRIASEVTLLILNKITTKSYKYTIKIGDIKEYERITVIPLFCWKTLPDEVKEYKVLLKIMERSVKKNISDNDEQKQLFYGWMFYTSPGISTLEHPIYDVTILGCE
jgi:hypothetical protein